MKPRAWNSTLPVRTGPMKRGKPLDVASGLGRGSALARKLERERARANAAGRSQAPREMRRMTSGCKPFPAAVAALLDARDTCQPDEVRCCQRCGFTRNLHRHHRRGKDSGGSEDRAHTQCCCNAVTLCLWCHAFAHAKPEQARAEGLIVSQSVDEPGSVGVMRFAAAEGGATQWPDCQGNWLQTAPEMREEVPDVA